ncbi:LPS export ABC transporter protein LptC [Tangfeifania diversioriginum]|uniref:LPS export ABC transporter protein LptC n=1 Tax=Tangfeifania diversioriginum TaxID=1168035 RepID=A0A1M6MUQ5_9BACT|nr:LPS export ABC transporter periplasmic protein LptC [Tangfeifania diversioriginum]SHJ87201.1 LPS export ABC transporter protein LptC [Tangfeifania diversioriginum]
MKQQQQGFKSKIVRFKGIAALLAGAAFLFFGCEKNNIEKIQAFSAPENLPQQEATNFETLFTDSGKVRFYLFAPKLLRFETDGDPFVEFPEGIELIRYDSAQNVVSSITADYAKQYEKEDKWEAKNNVIATNLDGDTLKTEHLIWEEKNEKIYSDEYVKIIRPDQIITGIGFESDQAMENWKIKNPKGTIFVEVNENEQTPADSTTVQPEEKQKITPEPGTLQFQN